MKRNWMTLTLVGMCCAVSLFILGCEWPWDDDDDEVQGTSTVQGYVTSFEAGGVAVSFAPAQERGALKAIITALSEALVPSAYAAGISGVTVELGGSGLSTATADNGFFILSGVSAGDYDLIFKYGDLEASYPLTVEDNVRIELTDVRVKSDATVTIGRVNVAQLGAAAETTTATTTRATTTTVAAATTTTTTTSTTTTTLGGGDELPWER